MLNGISWQGLPDGGVQKIGMDRGLQIPEVGGSILYHCLVPTSGTIALIEACLKKIYDYPP